MPTINPHLIGPHYMKTKQSIIDAYKSLSVDDMLSFIQLVNQELESYSYLTKYNDEIEKARTEEEEEMRAEMAWDAQHG